MLRVLKPGGLLATRDETSSAFYPASFELDRLWTRNLERVITHGKPGERVGPLMPALLLQAGFKRVVPGAGTKVVGDAEGRRRLAGRVEAQLGAKSGDAMKASWRQAGVSDVDLRDVVVKAAEWAEVEGAWWVSVQEEMLAWK